MQINKIITDYVSAKDTDYAIMIDGEWGAGKTWYWENVLAEQIKQIPTKDNTMITGTVLVIIFFVFTFSGAEKERI